LLVDLQLEILFANYLNFGVLLKEKFSLHLNQGKNWWGVVGVGPCL